MVPPAPCYRPGGVAENPEEVPDMRPTDDLLIPDDDVRGPDGQALGCRAFSRP